MKVNEFSDKYGVDYNTVYRAAGALVGLKVATYARDFDEDDLRESVANAAMKSAECAKNRLVRALKIYEKCKKDD